MARRGWRDVASPVVLATALVLAVGCDAAPTRVDGAEDTAPDAQVGPPVVPVGAPVVLGDAEVVVVGTQKADTIAKGLRQGEFLLAEVQLRNAAGPGAPALAYGPLDWVLEATDGSVLQPLALGDDGRLEFGSLDAQSGDGGVIGFDVAGRAPIGILWYAPGGTRLAGWHVEGPGTTTTTAPVESAPAGPDPEDPPPEG